MDRTSADRPAWRNLDPLVLSHRRLLGARLYQLCYVRLFFGLSIIVGALIGTHVIGVQGLNQSGLVTLGVVILLYNLVAFEMTRSHRSEADDAGPGQLLLLRVLYGAIIADYIVLTLAIWFVGGARSPFLCFFLLHAVVSGIMLSKRAALAFHCFAFALLVVVVLGEATGWIPAALPEGAVASAGRFEWRYAGTVIVAYGMLFVLIGWILTSFSTALREREHQLRIANAELSRLSEMRRDFLDIALHNLQSPIGVTMMYLRNLHSGLGGEVSNQQRAWVERGMERLGSLSGFLHDLSMLSTLESVQLYDKLTPIDVRTLLDDIVKSQRDAAQQRWHTMTLDNAEALAPVRGVELLLREALANFVTNAIKYTPRGGHIKIRSMQQDGMVRVEVEDDGVGIAAEDQERLFNEFVRLRVKGKPVAKVAGSGLGLTIVKRVIELHGGRTGVVSEPEKGSLFYAELPAWEGGTDHKPQTTNSSDPGSDDGK